jgi:hypothetical protein
MIKGRRLIVSLTIQAIYQDKKLRLHLLVFGGKNAISKQHSSQRTIFGTHFFFLKRKAHNLAELQSFFYRKCSPSEKIISHINLISL